MSLRDVLREFLRDKERDDGWHLCRAVKIAIGGMVICLVVWWWAGLLR